MLQKVRVNKRDTCLTYALRRSGINIPLQFIEDIDKYFICKELNTVGEKLTNFSVGSLVGWRHENYFAKDVGIEIISFDNIITEDVPRLMHIGVIEKFVGDNVYVSHASRKDHTVLPSIKVELVGTKKRRYPDVVFVLKKEYCNSHTVPIDTFTKGFAVWWLINRATYSDNVAEGYNAFIKFYNYDEFTQTFYTEGDD